MNKKYCIYSILMMILMASQPAFSMGGKFFKAARIAGVATLPCAGLYVVHKREQAEDEFLKNVTHPVHGAAINTWARKKMERLNVPNYELISFVYGKDWASTKKAVYVSVDDGLLLNDLLSKKAEIEKLLFEVTKDRDDFKKGRDPRSIDRLIKDREDELLEHFNLAIQYMNQAIEQYDKKIARESMILKHELGHVVNKDHDHTGYSLVATPVAVELLFFSITSGFRKIYEINPPKKLLGTIVRSGTAIGAIAPKMLINMAVLLGYARYQETQADKFACENAESRLELQEYANAFRALENTDWDVLSRGMVRTFEFIQDPMHPCLADRREVVESYLAEWDENNK